MSAVCFVDTNIFVYFRDLSEPEKQKQAEAWLALLWKSGTGRLSIQVLNEYYVTVTQRLRPGLERDVARSDVRNLMAWRPVSISSKVVEGAWTIQDRYGFSWWDSLIVSAAQSAGCDYLLSEDLQHQQKLGGITVINPFMFAPEKIGI